MASTTTDLEREIEALSALEIHVETNQGTYGANEAARKIGCAEPRFANREVYETVGGVRREVGPDEDRAPGRMRRINGDEMRRMRKLLADLRGRLRKLRDLGW